MTRQSVSNLSVLPNYLFDDHKVFRLPAQSSNCTAHLQVFNYPGYTSALSQGGDKLLKVTDAITKLFDWHPPPQFKRYCVARHIYSP